MKKINFKTMLATISLLAVAPISLNVLTCSLNNDSVLTKILLSDVITVREVEGSAANEADIVLEELANLNPGLQTSDVEITSFSKATEIASGSATISAKPNTNYTGSVGITITPLPKINLNDVITITKIDSANANDINSVLKEVARLNPNLSIKDVQITDFKAATEITSGSAIIKAKADTKYTGQVDINITPLPKINLNDVITITKIDSANANDINSVLKEVARLNPNLSIEDVQITDFKAATEITSGSAIIKAKDDTKYTGQVDINITPLPKINLNDVITNKDVNGSIANDINSVLKEVARLNPNLSIEDVQITKFNAATELTVGSAIIAARANSKYTGAVGITISQLTKKIALKDVIKETTVDGNLANDKNTVLAEVARLNPNLSIEDVQITTFNPAGEKTFGLALIVAKTNSKYTDSVWITILPLTKKIALIDVIKERTVDGNLANDPNTVLAEVVRLNPNLSIKDVQVTDFKAATEITSGWALIHAKPSSKYLGTVVIRISNLIKFS